MPIRSPMTPSSSPLPLNRDLFPQEYVSDRAEIAWSEVKTHTSREMNRGQIQEEPAPAHPVPFKNLR
jgi:hypothetical protein